VLLTAGDRALVSAGSDPVRVVSPARAASARPPSPVPPRCTSPPPGSGCCWSARTGPTRSARSWASPSATSSPAIEAVPGLSALEKTPSRPPTPTGNGSLPQSADCCPTGTLPRSPCSCPGPARPRSPRSTSSPTCSPPGAHGRVRPRPVRHRTHRTHHPPAAAPRLTDRLPPGRQGRRGGFRCFLPRLALVTVGANAQPSRWSRDHVARDVSDSRLLADRRGWAMLPGRADASGRSWRGVLRQPAVVDRGNDP
jgi:hypothetical protein